MELAAIEGRNEMEKFVHGTRNGEVVGGPANARRMKHATREGSKPSLLNDMEETTHHVISGRCEGIGKKENNRYREEMKGVLQKSKKLMMRDKHNNAGVVQANKSLRALEHPGRQANPNVTEDEEL
eukprot:1327035-Pleurochrysis_carterae.AAC.1